MDGTFLCDNRKLIAQNIEAVKRLREAGIIFCLASGRGISTIRPFWEQLGFTGPTVSSNGAFVVDEFGKVVANHALPDHVVKRLLEYARTESVHVNVYSGDHIFFSQDGEFAQLYRTRTGCEPLIQNLEDLGSHSATKLLFVDHPDQIVRHTLATKQILADQNISIVISEPDYLEFLPCGINKGNGLASLAAHLGLKAHEVAAIGDWTNDVEMLLWVGHSGCVANAAPEVVDVAKKLYSSNSNFGFTEFVTDILELKLGGIIRK